MSTLTQIDASRTSAMEELTGGREEFLRFAERRISDRAAAEDLLQSVYARAIGQVDSLRDSGAARAWFYRALHNAVIDFYRHRAVEDRVVSPMADDFEVPATTEQPRTICRCMDRAVDGLKPEYAEVLRRVELVDGESRSMEDYARRTGITQGNAAVRAFRARKALTKSLRHICGSCAGAGCLDCTCAQSAASTNRPGMLY